MELLNVGCGDNAREGWVNLDLNPGAAGVLACDVSQGLPFDSGVFDAVYCSHVLEHLPKAEAPALVAECLRVLRPGGIARFAVPDLEAIVRLYLRSLDRALLGDAQAEAEYDWMMLELFDQTVREVSGGQMRRHWERAPLPAESFVVERVGGELTGFLERLRRGEIPPQPPAPPGNARDEASLLAIGRFRRGGEVHHWMYDRLSLGRLLGAAGFAGVCVRAAKESAIPDFTRHHLDVTPDGRVRKPDSLFMEGARPLAG